MKQLQNNNISFKGQKVFVGIDVHKRSWTVTAITRPYLKTQATMPPSADALRAFLESAFPDAEYVAAYESGFTGFSTYYLLVDRGIECHIMNAADIPTSQYDKVMKTDKVDSRKIAETLMSGNFREVHPRPKDDLDDRTFCRLGAKLRKQIASCKVRAKHLLHTNGVAIPERFGEKRTYWSKAFSDWLLSVKLLSNTNHSMKLIVNQVASLRKNLLEVDRHVRNLSQSPKYAPCFNALRTIPGIGIVTAMHLIVEVGTDMSRFPNERAFASYLGLVPTCHDSGDSKSAGKKTFRGNKVLGTLLVEASWKAVINCPELGLYYNAQIKKIKPQKAIIKVARKLSNIIFHKMKSA